MPPGPVCGIRLAFARPLADVVAQRQFAEVRAALEEIDVRVQHAAQRFSRREDQLPRGEGALDLGAEGIQFAHRDGVEDLLLVGVEAVERAHRDARPAAAIAAGGDLLERNAAEQRRGGVEDLLDGLVAARLQRRPAVGWKRSSARVKRECDSHSHPLILYYKDMPVPASQMWTVASYVAQAEAEGPQAAIRWC